MLSLVPVSLREANEFVCQHHRHHKPTVGHKFSIGVREDGRLAGVAICGRPVSRFLDDGYTLEVNRLCTDGVRNACSMLYGAAVRAARAMGYKKVITYIPGQRVRRVPESLRLCMRGACRGRGVDGQAQAEGQRAVPPPDENAVGKILRQED